MNKLNLWLTLIGTAATVYFHGFWIGLAFYVGCQILWMIFFLATDTRLEDL